MASVSGDEQGQMAEPTEDTEDAGPLVGDSATILGKLMKRISILVVMNGAKLGRALKCALAYLTRGRLNGCDCHLLQRHLDLVPGLTQALARSTLSG